jgi:hypothetical protein
LAFRRGTPCQVCDLDRIKWRGETGEDASAQSGNDLVRCAVSSQNDALYAWPNGAHLLEQSQIFIDSTVGIGNDDSEGSHAQSLKSVGVAGGILYRKMGGGEGFANLAAHRGSTSNDQNPAHPGLRDGKLTKF